jgi:hypothetical protein
MALSLIYIIKSFVQNHIGVLLMLSLRGFYTMTHSRLAVFISWPQFSIDEATESMPLKS